MSGAIGDAERGTVPFQLGLSWLEQRKPVEAAGQARMVCRVQALLVADLAAGTGFQQLFDNGSGCALGRQHQCGAASAVGRIHGQPLRQRACDCLGIRSLRCRMQGGTRSRALPPRG